MKKSRVLAILIVLVMVFSLLPASAYAQEYEWWDLRAYKEQEYINSVTDVDSEFAGWRDLVGTYGEGGPELTVRHYWGWYYENPNSTRQRFDIYVPSHATANSPILHMVNNTAWTSNSYPYAAPAYNAETGVFKPGNDTSANALNRGYIVLTSGVRTYGVPAENEGFGKSPATFADSKAVLRFLRANMGPDKAITVGNPDLVFVTGFSGGGALANILGASGDSPDYFAEMYELGAAGLEWKGKTPFADATLAEKTAAANWSSTISDAYLGVVSWAGMDDFQMGEQALAWFTSEKRWEAPNPATKTAAMMLASNDMALEYVEYVNGLGLKDENGKDLTAPFTIKENPEEGGVAGGSFLDATVDLVEKEIEYAFKSWKNGTATDYDYGAYSVIDSLAPFWNMEVASDGSYDYTKVNASVLINGEAPTEALADPANIPDDIDVEITDHTQFTLGLTNKIEKGSVFAYSSPMYGFVPLDPETWNEVTDTAGLYGPDDEHAMPMHKTAWDYYAGEANVGKKNTGLEWEDYLKTEEGQYTALQMKMASSMPYLNTDHLDAFPYLSDAGFYGSNVAQPARYWFARFGANDQSNSYSFKAMQYYSLMRNPAVDFENSDLHLYVWNKPHASNYENIFPWIDKVVAEYTGTGAAGGSLDRFKAVCVYKGYPDVDETKWYGTENSGVICDATLLGIVKGDDKGNFRPEDGVTLGEVVKMAAVVNDTYYGTRRYFDQSMGEKWYDTYVDFAVKQGIIKDGEFKDFDRNATRAEIAYIFANALPAEELAAKSSLQPPDVNAADKYAAEIFLLYAAGVLEGNDEAGTFDAERDLTRAEAAAIITRVACPDKR